MARTRSLTLVERPDTPESSGWPGQFRGAADVRDTTGVENRRVHTRLTPPEIAWLRAVRLRHGPSVSLINLSVSGALFETEFRLQPGSESVLELVGGGKDALVPFRVVRSHVSVLRGGLRYRGACEFKRHLELPGLRPRPSIVASPALDDSVKLDYALKNILNQYVSLDADVNTPASSSGMGSAQACEVIPALKSLQAEAARRRTDPLARRLCDLLTEVVPALQRGDQAGALVACIEKQLRRALPLLTIRLAESPPTIRLAGSESIYFSVEPEDGASSQVLNVEFPVGFGLDEWQFRFLKVSAHLIKVVRRQQCGLAGRGQGPRADPATRVQLPGPPPPLISTPKVAGQAGAQPEPADVPSGWHKVIVRYTDGSLLKSYTQDFNATRPHFHLSPSMTAAASERMMVPLSRLKAVFFVRDFAGNAAYVEQKTADQPQHGRKVEVTFIDGEVILGSTLSYRPDGQGFFVVPTDPGSNNIRIFVMSGSVRHVRFP